MHLIRFTSKYLYPLLFILSIGITGTCIADQNDPLQIIDLKNQPADKIIPIIKPMLKPNDAITGTGFQLFLRTDDKTFEEITRLLHVMDKAPRNLVIKVRNNLDSESMSTDFNTSGNYKIGDTTKVIVGKLPSKDEGTKVRINSNRSSTDIDAEHMIRVIEGGQAFIAAGKIRPYEHRTIIRHRHGVSVYDSVDYQDVTSGFYVTPRLIGNNKVSLHVQPHYRTANQARSGTIDVQEAGTRVEANLGEWIQIGGIGIGTKSKDSAIISTSHSSNNTQSEIYLKVDLE